MTGTESVPVPMPIRILVKGASTVNWLSGMGGPRTDFAFPRVVEQTLRASGRPVQLETVSVASELTSTTLRHWEREVLGFSPDVIVLVYGHYESIHLFLPRWLERHANSLKSRPRRLGRLYRRHLLRPVWMILARAQARVDTVLDPTIRRARSRHVAADLQTLIGHVQKVGSPLVVVFELLPPAARYRSWFPGMTRRIEVMNRELADMVVRVARPNVRFFRTGEVVTKYLDGDIDRATPDGFHYSPELHRHVGEQLAGEIMAWADTQPHLRAQP
jgi:hypothetical protein